MCVWMHMNKINKKIYLWMYVGGKMYENRIRTGRFFFLKSPLFLSCERVNLEQENSTYLFWIFQFRFMLNFLICRINRAGIFIFFSVVLSMLLDRKYVDVSKMSNNFFWSSSVLKKTVSSLWKKITLSLKGDGVSNKIEPVK